MTLLMPGSLETPPVHRSGLGWERMIGCPRGEGGHPLAVVINAGRLGK